MAFGETQAHIPLGSNIIFHIQNYEPCLNAAKKEFYLSIKNLIIKLKNICGG
jgi:hypothetical protein